MNETPHHERLLADILAEDSDAARRELLLGEMLGAARRRRRFRQARRVGSVVALVALTLWIMWPRIPPAATQPGLPKGYLLVETRPLPKHALIETEPLPAASIVSSLPTAHILATAATRPPLVEINDADLLALAAPTPAVLVRREFGSAELVFVPSLDAQPRTGEPSTREPHP
jgi:hypothetical protein